MIEVDVLTGLCRIIPLVARKNAPRMPDMNDCVQAMAVNKSRSYFVCNASLSDDIGIYALPDLSPVCIGTMVGFTFKLTL